jgi:hypothetical protein
VTPNKRFICRVCGPVLPAWLPVTMQPKGAMLIHHPGQDHPDEVGLYLDRMHRAEDIWAVVVEAFEVVQD